MRGLHKPSTNVISKIDGKLLRSSKQISSENSGSGNLNQANVYVKDIKSIIAIEILTTDHLYGTAKFAIYITLQTKLQVSTRQ